MERPLLADVQQKTFERNRGGWPMDLIAHTATQGLYLRRHSKFGGRMRARGRMADCSDPAHAWSTYRMRVLSSFWAWLDGPLISQHRPGNAVAAAGGDYVNNDCPLLGPDFPKPTALASSSLVKNISCSGLEKISCKTESQEATGIYRDDV